MLKNKTVRSVFFAVFCLFACISLSYAESCSAAGQVQYKPSGSCGTSERTCCLNRQWSDWGGSCPSCECSYGETKEIPCKDSDFMEEPEPDNEWAGNIKMTCDCRWKAGDTSACKLKYVFVKLKINVDNAYRDIARVASQVKITDADERNRYDFSSLSLNYSGSYIESEVIAVPNGQSYHIDDNWNYVATMHSNWAVEGKYLYCNGSFSFEPSSPTGEGAFADYPFEFEPSCEWRD